MADIVNVRVVRPYRTVEDYVPGDAWTVTKKELVLVTDAAPPAEARVRFEVFLESGQRILRGEGDVVGPAHPDNGHPGGLRVALKRFDSASKELLKKLLLHRRAQERAPAPKPESSGTHRKVPGPVSAPRDRDALLERLRQRAATAQKA